MARPPKIEFIPTNSKKYVGKKPIILRSSWELIIAKYYDKSPAILSWSSESITIPYRNPLTRTWSFYVPDFLVQYVDKAGQQHVELQECKPMKEVPGFTERVSSQTKLIQAINMAKWAAATAYCIKHGIKFRVLTENQIFGMKLK